MESPFPDFVRHAREFRPGTAVILGSGLAQAIRGYQPTFECPFGRVPGLGQATVHGHAGKVSVGLWADYPVMVFHGRLHYYEGHSWERVTRTIAFAAETGVTTLILTNAAGGIHPALRPGDLMAIQSSLSWLGPRHWLLPKDETLFDSAFVRFLVQQETDAGRTLRAGTYAALTGPCYETPAEIRALKAIGADAVGMSTVREAMAGREAGMRVAGISCITNAAAGLSAGPLDHREVIANAAAPAERVGRLIELLLKSVAGTAERPGPN